MFDNTVESLTRYRQSPGFGCILADAMGLGKTLQVVTFVDIFLRHTEAQKVLIVVPVNTLQNWNAEMNRWLPPSGGGEGDNEVGVVSIGLSHSPGRGRITLFFIHVTRIFLTIIIMLHVFCFSHFLFITCTDNLSHVYTHTCNS